MTPCKLVTEGLGSDGYAVVWQDGKQVRLARLILAEKLGRDIKPNHFACHTCDTPNCIEPEHLYEGTNRQNVQDMIRRGRHVSGWGLTKSRNTHCPKGHEFTAENTYVYKSSRRCKICSRQQKRASRRSLKMSREKINQS